MRSFWGAFLVPGAARAPDVLCPFDLTAEPWRLTLSFASQTSFVVWSNPRHLFRSCCQRHSLLRLRDLQHVRHRVHRPADPPLRHLRSRHLRRDMPQVRNMFVHWGITSSLSLSQANHYLWYLLLRLETKTVRSTTWRFCRRLRRNLGRISGTIDPSLVLRSLPKCAWLVLLLVCAFQVPAAVRLRHQGPLHEADDLLVMDPSGERAIYVLFRHDPGSDLWSESQ